MKIKKFLALALATAMTLTMSMTAFAEGETHSVTITNTKNATVDHTYEVYQVFAGTFDAESGKLTDIVWGANVTGITWGEKTYDSAADFAEALSGMASNSEEATALAKAISAVLVGDPVAVGTTSDAKVTINGLTPGYYFIKDQDGSLNGADDSYTSYVLEVVGKDVDVKAKADVPSVEKKVQDINDSLEDVLSALQDSADYDIGDDVPYTLTGTLPSNYDAYKTYTMIFHDKMEKGLTFNGDVKVTVDGEEISAYEVVIPEDGDTFDVKIADLKTAAPSANAASKVVVTFTAKLNTDCIRGAVGNKNTVYMEYSNNPNNSGEGTGKTPEDTVIVFTFVATVNKVNPEMKPLAGAEFAIAKLDKKTGEFVDLNVVVTAKDEVEGCVFTVDGIDDGIYRITETKAPAGYNSVEPFYFEVKATHDEVSDDPKLNSLDAYQVDDNKNFVAMDASDVTAQFVTAIETGLVSTDVVNKSGSLLPSTGGIGTTIFYVIGGILVIGAGVILITKKRMGEQE